MKLIKPSEISGRILTLLDESDERVIIVSPYMKISKWYKFINKVDSLKSRKIPHLHNKPYLNERYGIVTYMKLLLRSAINSLEIGYA